VSTREQMRAAEDAGADYAGVQTIFATPTKPEEQAEGLDLVRVAAATLTIPWFAIGGVDLSNVEEVTMSGAPGVAVVRAIRDAEDPEAAARELRAVLDR
jgi:thiamine-phosphate pyrophosphorylase